MFCYVTKFFYFRISRNINSTSAINNFRSHGFTFIITVYLPKVDVVFMYDIKLHAAITVSMFILCLISNCNTSICDCISTNKFNNVNELVLTILAAVFKSFF